MHRLNPLYILSLRKNMTKPIRFMPVNKTFITKKKILNCVIEHKILVGLLAYFTVFCTFASCFS